MDSITRAPWVGGKVEKISCEWAGSGFSLPWPPRIWWSGRA